MKRRFRTGILLGVVTGAYLLLHFLMSFGLNPNLYLHYQMEAGILAEAGISEEELRRLDTCLAACLDGATPISENRGATADGALQKAFNERELRHLEDCRRLMRLAKIARNVLAFACFALHAVFLALWLKAKRAERTRMVKALLLGEGIFILPFLAFGLWAWIDFHGAFAFFHRLLFTNDLWLLDPRTDLLIRICPSSMFAGIGLRIAQAALAAMLALPLFYGALGGLLASLKRKKEIIR